MKKMAEKTPEQITALLEKNLKWSEVIYEQNKKIQRRLTWMAIGSYLRLLLILIPLIVAIVYLPKLMKQFTSVVQMNGSGSEELLQELLKTYQGE